MERDPFGDAAWTDSALKHWVRWLRGLRWDFFATPAFKYEVTQARAVRAVQEWLEPFGPRAYAVVAFERGPAGGREHCHALIGGIGRHALRENLLRGSWRRGSITLAPYHPSRGAVAYLVGKAGNTDGLEVLGSPKPYRPKNHGRRGRQRNGGLDDATTKSQSR